MYTNTIDKINIGIIVTGTILLLVSHNFAGFCFGITALMQTIRIVHMQSQQGE